MRIWSPRLEEEEEDVVLEGYMAPLQPDVIVSTDTGPQNAVVMKDKPKRTWKTKVYPTSAVHRSARVRQRKKFHDET